MNAIADRLRDALAGDDDEHLAICAAHAADALDELSSVLLTTTDDLRMALRDVSYSSTMTLPELVEAVRARLA